MDDAPRDKRKAILQATLGLLSEQGFQGTPMSQIARRADAGVGTIYRYFPSKDDLINALYIDVKLRIAQFVLPACTGDMPVHKAFKTISRALIQFFVENPDVLSFAEQYINSPLITAATREAGSRIIEPLNMLFRRAIGQDLLKPLPVRMMGDLIYGSLVALAKYSINGGGEPDDIEIAAGIDAIWDMIRS
jgi:TetR/AcrR family transcriptional regulator, repressor of fatR-cypB operon